jgi:N-acetylglucosaminyldiphosphoundecaprenol N-acetyl-beta-D-mannosaminyltransferase
VAAGGRVVIGHHNLHSLHLLSREPAMAEFDRRADGSFLDGMGVLLLARWLGHPLERRLRVTYADWIEPLAAEAARSGWRLLHVGGRPGVGEEAASRLAGRHPGLAIGSLPGYFDAAPGSSENAAVLQAIRAAAPHVLLVGMGMPRQERWVVENLDSIAANVILTCGACMDYVAGVVPTPPRWAGRLGLEWLFRLAAEPRRLGRRYLVEPWSLVGPAWRERRTRGSRS